ncbi:MAG: GtrA family protein [Methanomassiliicoccaceae archaeon]|jgi:putative flippase GtrA|nr:GtrA family protein [Methanomassiliicoccaceae archaeon]
MKNEKNTEPQGQTEFTPKENVFMVAKYWLIAISAGVIQLISFAMLKEFNFLGDMSEYGWNYFIALTLSVLWNFTINRHYTFRSVANVPVAMSKVFCYYLVFTPLSILWGVSLAASYPDMEYLILIGTMLINGVTEFLFMRFVVFRRTINTNRSALKQRAEKESEGSV